MQGPLSLDALAGSPLRLTARIGQDGADLTKMRILSPEEKFALILLALVLLACVERPAFVTRFLPDCKLYCRKARNAVACQLD